MKQDKEVIAMLKAKMNGTKKKDVLTSRERISRAVGDLSAALQGELSDDVKSAIKDARSILLQGISRERINKAHRALNDAHCALDGIRIGSADVQGKRMSDEFHANLLQAKKCILQMQQILPFNLD